MNLFRRSSLWLNRISLLSKSPSAFLHQRNIPLLQSSQRWNQSDSTEAPPGPFDPSVASQRLKKLSEAIVQRSPTRHISRKQFDSAAELCRVYYNCEPVDRFEYLCFLSQQFSTSFETTTKSVASFQAAQLRHEPFDPALLVDRLRSQIRPKYFELFRLISRLDNGVKFLVDLRSDLLTILGSGQVLKSSSAIVDQNVKVFLRLMSNEISDLLSLWFSAGFLKLERVTWDSPTSILQKITEYEAVHPIKSWLDLRHRVGLYRRCYMFSHSCLPGEPLVILHVALVPEISTSIQAIIEEQRTARDVSSEQETHASAERARASGFSHHESFPSEDPSRIGAAVFYSISSTQKGLNGIDLGHQMIQQVASELRAEFPSLNQFSSLSPIPNFTEYLFSVLQSALNGSEVEEKSQISTLWHRHDDFEKLRKTIKSNSTFRDELPDLLRNGNWVENPEFVNLLHRPLMRICSHYLHNEKRRGYALNSVANFHLKNGAVMWRLNWLADTSPRGLANSCGMMINYRYYLDRQQDNSQTYLNEKHIAAGEQFCKWLKQ